MVHPTETSVQKATLLRPFCHPERMSVLARVEPSTFCFEIFRFAQNDMRVEDSTMAGALIEQPD